MVIVVVVVVGRGVVVVVVVAAGVTVTGPLMKMLVLKRPPGGVAWLFSVDGLTALELQEEDVD